MKTLGISVEGPTEREFVNLVLRPHLRGLGWGVVKPVSLDGGVSLRRVREEVRRLVDQFDHVTTFYDFYGFSGHDGRDADALEAAIQSDVGQAPNFQAYVQRHEFEALVFANPQLVAAHFGDTGALKRLHSALQGCRTPEDVNHGYDTCPSRQLKLAFPTYDKVRHGAVLVQKIGLPHLRATCPRFGAWLTRLESLVTPSPTPPPSP